MGNILNAITNFFNQPFFIIVGGFATILMIAGFLYTAYSVIKGISPVLYRLYRLGNGLAKRKIAIFAKTDHMESICSLLTDSKLFKQKNIIKITTSGDLMKAEEASIYLVYRWYDWSDEIIDGIFALTKDSTALIIYAPQSEGLIKPQERLDKINSHRNAVVVNFRGRLLNDIVTSMITTSYHQ